MAAWPPSPTPLTTGLFKLLPLDWIAKPPSLPTDLAGELPEGGRQGSDPIHWWAAGMYSGRLRRQLLYLRTHTNPAMVAAAKISIVQSNNEPFFSIPRSIASLVSWGTATLPNVHASPTQAPIMSARR